MFNNNNNIFFFKKKSNIMNKNTQTIYLNNTREQPTLCRVKIPSPYICGMMCGKTVLGLIWESIASIGMYVVIFSLTSTGVIIPDISRIIIGLTCGIFMWMFRASCGNPIILFARFLTLQLGVLAFLSQLVTTFIGALIAGLLVYAG